jgi:hypothetical protein
MADCQRQAVKKAFWPQELAVSLWLHDEALLNDIAESALRPSFGPPAAIVRDAPLSPAL